jgi:hypothetical protein
MGPEFLSRNAGELLGPLGSSVLMDLPDVLESEIG